MRTRYVIEAELYGERGELPGAAEFARRFDAYARGRTTVYDLPDEPAWREALAAAARHGLKAQTFFSFQLDAEELKAWPAVYFGVELVEGLLGGGAADAAQLAGRDLAKDYESEQLVATGRARLVLEAAARGLRWAEAGGGLWLLTVTARLPQPVVVPAPAYAGANAEPPGTYAVRSDGRDVVTTENAAALREAGLALSEEVRAGSQTLRWRPRLLASGALVHALLAAGVRGLTEPPAPLLPESHPLARHA